MSLNLATFCQVCDEEQTKLPIPCVKACCGHLVRICDACFAGERKRVMHEKCGRCSGKLSDTERGAQIEAENLRAFKLVQLEYKFLERMYMHVVEVSRKTIDTSDVIDLSKSSHHNITFGKR